MEVDVFNCAFNCICTDLGQDSGNQSMAEFVENARWRPLCPGALSSGSKFITRCVSL